MELTGNGEHMRKLLFNLHLYTALVAGTFILILGVTGSIMAFEPEIDRLCHWKLTYVTPQPHALSLEEITAAVANQLPGNPIVDYAISTSPDISYQLTLKNHEIAYVNQYSGAVLGARNGPDFVEVLLTDIHQLHLRMLWKPKGSNADPGKVIMSGAGVAAFFLLLSGLYLWWPLKRIKIQLGGGTPTSARRFWFDLHNVVGIFSIPFLLLLTFTGVMIGFDDKTVPLFYQVTGSEPARLPRVKVARPPGAKSIAPVQAITIAKAALPGAVPFDVNVPPPTGVYQMRARFPEDLTPGGRSVVIVDQYSGKILYVQGSRTAPAGRRIETTNRAIHTGDIFGIPSKIVMSLASAMASLQLITGVVMWWKKRKQFRAERSV